MQARHRLNQLLSSISHHGLQLDSKGSCQMRCTNGLICAIELMPDNERAFGYIPISRLPGSEASRAALLQEALSLNLQLQQEDVLSLVYDARIDNITLCSQCEIMEVSLDEFDHWLGHLIQKSEYIRSKLVEAGLQASLNRTQEERRQAIIKRQEERKEKRKLNSMATVNAITEHPLHHAVRNAQLFKL